MSLKDYAGRKISEPLVFDVDLPDYGELMTRQDWLETVEGGGFIDYDGNGAPSDGKKMSRAVIYPSIADQLPQEATHVMWFNR